MLKIYSTLGKKNEEFKPLVPGKVSIYVCGPTVYNLLHVGNFRGPVFFNFVRNWLEYLGYQVTYALNFTDVDDKIINKAREEGRQPHEVSEHYIREYKKDFASLGLRSHDVNPKVTEHMDEIVLMIKDIVKSDKAYVSAQDVLFSIVDCKEYGKLSGRRPDELQAGVRIDLSEKKKNPLDFALWKSAKQGEPSWPSPWGPGRPGWHIECSAMIKSIFGEQIDIHGGGIDLVFPHHENEIAQTEAVQSKKFVNYWMHWNMIEFSGSKMSKSVGNVVALRDFLKEHHAEIFKWMILTSHYRSVADYSNESIHIAVMGLARVYSALALAEEIVATTPKLPPEKNADAYTKELSEAWQKIEEAVNDDFGTPAAFAVLFGCVRRFNSQFRRGMKSSVDAKVRAELFIEFVKKFGALMSLFQESPTQYLTELDNKLLAKMGLSRGKVDELVQQRAQARAAKDFAQADELRQQLSKMQISISDLPNGSFWEVEKKVESDSPN